MRILFHAPGLAAFRPEAGLPYLLGVQPSVTDSLDGLLVSHRLTGNRGNIIHAEAPARTFSKSAHGSAYGNIAVLQRHLGDRYVQAIAENFDLIIISMANFIRPDHDGATLVKALRPLTDRVPFIALGCGLQGTHALSEMMPGNRDLIAHFDSHAQVFGVRGEKTANWLSENGFRNARVLGCPSLYAYPHSIMAIDGTAARRKGQAADVMTAGHLSLHRGRIVPRGIELAKAFRTIKAAYVFQDEFLTYGDLSARPGLYVEGSSEVRAGPVNEWLSGQCGTRVDFHRYYYFNEAGAWRQASLRHDVFIGDRFHGGVAALQAGQPAIFLTHDNRVSELTGHFGLPRLSTQDFARRGLADTLDEFLSPGRLDSMKALYKRRYAEYCDALAPFGLRPAIAPDALAPVGAPRLSPDTPAPSGPSPMPRPDRGPAAAPALRVPTAVRGANAKGATVIRQGPYLLRMVTPGAATDLVVTFEAANTAIDRRNKARRGFGEEFLLGKGYAVLSVLTASANWFLPPALRYAFMRPEVQAFRSGHARTHTYGAGMGAFGALTFADLLGASTVVALQPVSSLAADLVPWETRFAPGRALNWDGPFRDAARGFGQVGAAYAFFDPSTPDARHVDRLALTGGDRLRRIPVDDAGQAVPRSLQRRGVLEAAVLACLGGASEAEVRGIVTPA